MVKFTSVEPRGGGQLSYYLYDMLFGGGGALVYSFFHENISFPVYYNQVLQ